MQTTAVPGIREARRTDAEILAKLSGELGYPATSKEIAARLDKLFASSDNGIYVAELGFVVGWIHVAVIQTLESSAYVEMCGLVVAENHRGAGIGRLLVTAAEQWARDKGYSRLRVRTNIVREQTKKFYRELGFQTRKTQEVFEKIL